MKVKDAVIHYEGKWPGLSHGKQFLVYRKIGELHHWGFWDESPLNDSWQRVCSKQEFEACDYTTLKVEKHENAIHAFADSLLNHFYGSEAKNYLECTFSNIEKPEDSFVVTMQKTDGKTPCEVIAERDIEIAELKAQLKESRKPYDFNAHVSS